jgi:hypothetical protein
MPKRKLKRLKKLLCVFSRHNFRIVQRFDDGVRIKCTRCHRQYLLIGNEKQEWDSEHEYHYSILGVLNEQESQTSRKSMWGMSLE